MDLIADLHTHTLASSHAYGTVHEMAHAAAQKALYAIAITDHGIALPDAPYMWHFENLRVLPNEIEGVRILRGIEANILNSEGLLDMPDKLLAKLDFVVCSAHVPTMGCNSTVDECTNAYLRLLDHPHVDALGHTGDPRFAYDMDTVVAVAAEKGKLIELNNTSLTARKGSFDNCLTIAKLCVKYGTLVVINSDAHTPDQVGVFDDIMQIVETAQIPQSQIINASIDSLNDYLGRNH